MKQHPKLNQYLQHLLTESPTKNIQTPPSLNQPTPTDHKKKFSLPVTPKLALSLSHNLTLNFSKKTLDLLLQKSKSAFKDTFQQSSPTDTKQFIKDFKDNLIDSIQQEDSLNYFNLLFPSIIIKTRPDSIIKDLEIDFNLNHDPSNHDSQINFNVKGSF